jgi:PAS domain S-box-containing protein
VEAGGRMSEARWPRLGGWACLTAAGLGAMGLVGWASGLGFLTTLVPGLPPIMPNAAFALVLLGGAGALHRSQTMRQGGRVLSALAALVVLALGLATLAEYVLRVDLGIDQLLLASRVGPYPGRPSPPTALAFVLLAAGLLGIELGGRSGARLSEWLVVAAGLIALMGLAGSFFGAGSHYRLGGVSVIGVSLITALGLLFTSAGLLLQRASSGLLRVVLSAGPGGVTLRRLAAPAIVGPTLISYGVIRTAEILGVEGLPIVVAVIAPSVTLVALLLLSMTAAALDRAYEALDASRRLTRDLVDHAPDGIFIADLEGRYTDVNEAGCRMLGYSREELIGKTIVDLLPPEDVSRLACDRERLLAGGTSVADWLLRRKDGAFLPVEVSAKILADGRWQGFVRDISERKRLEAQAEESRRELVESEERFRLTMYEAPIGMALVALDGRFLRVNRVMAEIVGYTPDELVRLTFQDITHPDDLDVDLEQAQKLLRGEVPRYQLEKRYLRKGGEVVHVMLSGAVVRDPVGAPVHFIAQVEDITERKRAERALRASEAKFSGLVSIAPDAIVSVDEEQRLVIFNRSAERIFGWTAAEVLGKKLDVLIPERLRAQHRQHFETFAASAEDTRFLHERPGIFGLRKDGTEFPGEAAISKLVLDGTRLFTVVMRDITDRLRTEREQHFLAEFSAVLSSSLDVDATLTKIAWLATREFTDCCFVDLVQEGGAAKRHAVAHADPAKEAPCWILRQISPDQPSLVRAAIVSGQPVLEANISDELLQSVAQSPAHLRALRELSPTSFVVAPMTARGRMLGALAFITTRPPRRHDARDLNFAKELAERAALALENARLYELARRAVQVREEVLGIVAHDLRNPLNVIHVQSELLRRRGAEPERRAQKPVDTIRRAADRMNRLIQDLLDVTRMEAGRLTVERTRVAPRALLLDVLEASRLLADAASLCIQVELSSKLPDLLADRDRLQQVFENLLSNAIKFTPAHGRILVGAQPRGSEVLFWVSDTGPGIPEADLPHLFDRFWQAKAADRRGAGLGLPIVKGLVEAHGGHIWVKSEVGQGTTFFFTVPTAPMERERQAPAHDAS